MSIDEVEARRHPGQGWATRISSSRMEEVVAGVGGLAGK